MADQKFSVVNRVRFTAWAWLVSAFLLGLTVGAVGAGVPLSIRLADANASLTRQMQLRQLEEGLDPAGDLAALSSGGAAVGLEIASGTRGAAGAPPSVSPAAPRISQLAEVAQQAAPTLPAAGTGALKPLGAEAIQSSSSPIASVSLEAPGIPATTNQLPAQRASTAPAPATAPTPAEKPGDDQRRASRTASDAKIAEERERKAREEREEHRQKVERERQASAAKKAAQEASQRERDEAAARAAAARAKLVADSRPAGRTEMPSAPAPSTIGTGSASAPASGGAPAAAAMNSPTERVTKDEAGLAEVHAGSVTFKSGRRVNVGDSFPSGEKLISVDPALGEIVTSRRRIVIKAS